MKNNKIKALVKAARKTAKEDIQNGLITYLKESTGKLQATSKKLDKKIEKGAKILAKKIAKELVIDGAPLLNDHNVKQAEKASGKTSAPKAKPVAKPDNATASAKPVKTVVAAS